MLKFEETDTDIVEHKGLGEKDERGEELSECCEQNDQIIMTTWFTKHPGKHWTWKSPDGIFRNQISYIAVIRRYRNTVRIVRTHPEADCNSDHNMLVGDIKVKLQSYSPKLALEILEKDKDVKEKVYKEIETKIETAN